MPARRAAGKRSRSPSPSFDTPLRWGGGNSRPRRVVLVMMTRLATAFVLATLLAGCGLAADAPASSPGGSGTNPTPSPEARTLLARPRELCCPLGPRDQPEWRRVAQPPLRAVPFPPLPPRLTAFPAPPPPAL